MENTNDKQAAGGIDNRAFHELAMDYRGASPMMAHEKYKDLIAYIDQQLDARAEEARRKGYKRGYLDAAALDPSTPLVIAQNTPGASAAAPGADGLPEGWKASHLAHDPRMTAEWNATRRFMVERIEPPFRPKSGPGVWFGATLQEAISAGCAELKLPQPVEEAAAQADGVPAPKTQQEYDAIRRLGDFLAAEVNDEETHPLSTLFTSVMDAMAAWELHDPEMQAFFGDSDAAAPTAQPTPLTDYLASQKGKTVPAWKNHEGVAAQPTPPDDELSLDDLTRYGFTGNEFGFDFHVAANGPYLVRHEVEEFVERLRAALRHPPVPNVGKPWTASEALRYAAKVIELYDDATMQGDYMLSSTDCAGILTAMAEMPMFAAPNPDAEDAARYRWLLENYARGDGYTEIDAALNDGEAEKYLSPAIDAARAAANKDAS